MSLAVVFVFCARSRATQYPGMQDRVGSWQTMMRGCGCGLAVWLAACGSSFSVDGGADAAQDAGPEVVDAGPDAQPDSGPRDSGVGDSGSPSDPPEGDYESFVHVDQRQLSSGDTLTDLLAVFFAKRPGDVVIEREPVGSCELLRTLDPAPDGFELVEDADIGPITLRAGDRVAELRKGSPGYSPLRLDEALWSTGGERVTVVSEGRGDFSALRVELDAPSPAGLVTPAVPTTGRLEVRAEDLAIEWEGGSVGEVTIKFIYTNRARDDVESITCRYAGAAGAGIVPAAVFQRILADASDPSAVTVAMETEQSVRTRIDGWRAPITVNLTSEPTSRTPFGVSVLPD